MGCLACADPAAMHMLCQCNGIHMVKLVKKPVPVVQHKPKTNIWGRYT